MKNIKLGDVTISSFSQTPAGHKATNFYIRKYSGISNLVVKQHFTTF
ncbi:hypothetical protein [Ferruginibacter sp.]